MERARLEKKIMEIQLKKGITNLKNFKNLEKYLREDSLPIFNHSIEKTKFKDTFDYSATKKNSFSLSVPTRSGIF